MTDASMLKNTLNKGLKINAKKVEKISKKVLTNRFKVCIITIVVSDH